MKTIGLFAIVLWSALLAGCGGGTGVQVNNHQPEPNGRDYIPVLRAFHLIDSYGVSTEEDYFAELVLDPYYDAGLFEIDWRVDSLEDYLVEFRINDRPELAGSRRIYSETCGAGLNCDLGAIRLCQYYSDLTMACGLDETVTDISHMIYTLPQEVYAVLQVCDLDSDYCEYEYHPVWVE